MQTSATQVSSLPGVRCQCVCLRVNNDVVIASYFGHTSSSIECNNLYQTPASVS